MELRLGLRIGQAIRASHWARMCFMWWMFIGFSQLPHMSDSEILTDGADHQVVPIGAGRPRAEAVISGCGHGGGCRNDGGGEGGAPSAGSGVGSRNPIPSTAPG
jgi:hypothetical protein